MALTQANLSAAITVALSAANTGLASTTFGPQTVSFNLNSLSLTTWTGTKVAQYTVAPAATQTVNFYQFTDQTAVAVTAGHILCLVVVVTGGPITVAPGAAAGLVWFFGGTLPTVTVGRTTSGGLLVLSEGVGSAGQVVDNTHKNLDFVNNGATTTTLTLAAIVGP